MNTRHYTLAIFLVLATLPALAQDALATAPKGAMNITVQTGVGDTLRSGAMTPIFVTVANGDKAYDGRVSASFLNAGKETVSVYRNLPLAANSAKRITLYLPVTGQTSHVQVVYEINRGPLGWRNVKTVRFAVDLTDSEMPVVAGLDQLPRGLPPDKSADNRRVYNRFFMRAADLPDRHEGLSMFDALFISPPPLRPFSGAQVQALYDWVLRGGILVVNAAAPADAYAENRLGRFMPFIPQGNNQRSFTLFDRDVLHAIGTPREAELLLESDGVPLVMRRNVGLGSVVAFALTPDDPALLNWEGRDELWTKIFGAMLTKKPKREIFSGNPNDFFGDRYGKIADAMAAQVTEAPSTGMRLGLVLLMTGLYALVAGPGDYLFVRRMKRPRLTWITFPLIVAFFTGAAYVGARYWIGGDWEMRRVERILIIPQEAAAISTEITGAFIPHGAEYAIDNDAPGMLRHIGGHYGLDDRARIDGDTGTIRQRIPIWTHRVFLRSETLRTYPDITIDWSTKGSMLIRNNSELTIRPRYFFAGVIAQSLWEFEVSIPPGEEARIPIEEPEYEYTARFDKDSLILFGLAVGDPGESPFGRELNLRSALARGARVVTFDAPGDPSPLRFDGEVHPTASTERVIQVLDYPTGNEPQTEAPPE